MYVLPWAHNSADCEPGSIDSTSHTSTLDADQIPFQSIRNSGLSTPYKRFDNDQPTNQQYEDSYIPLQTSFVGIYKKRYPQPYILYLIQRQETS